MLALLTDANAWAALLTLTAVEIVLGIDNLVFIALLTARLDKKRSQRARAIGLSLAFIFRVLLLASLSSIMAMTRPVFSLGEFAFSFRDIILLAGGLFLIVKATREIHVEVEGEDEAPDAPHKRALWAVIVQLAVIDLVFSDRFHRYRHRPRRSARGHDRRRGHRHGRDVCRRRRRRRFY